MICRLCLRNLVKEFAIPLFATNRINTHQDIIKHVKKYVNLQLSPHDTISTSICQNCADHLEDFHRFYMYVEQKQSSLQSENENEIMEALAPAKANEDFVVHIKYEPVECDVHRGVERMQMVESDDELPVTNEAMTDSDETNASPPTKIKKVNNPVKVPHKASQKALIKSNEEIITNFMELSCDLCKLPVTTYSELRAHFETVHRRVPYVQCCSEMYTDVNKIVEHINWHRNPANFSSVRKLNKQVALDTQESGDGTNTKLLHKIQNILCQQKQMLSKQTTLLEKLFNSKCNQLAFHLKSLQHLNEI